MPLYFALVPIGILSFLYTFVGFRFIAPLQLAGQFKLFAWILISLAAAFPIASVLMLVMRVEDRISDFIAWLAYLSLGFASILFFLLIIKDLFVFSGFLFEKISLLFNTEAKESLNHAALSTPGEGRRQVLWTSFNLALLGLTGVITGCGVVHARHRLKTEKVTVPLAKLPKEFEGIKIVQLSDIHVGPTIKRDFVREMVEQTNALNPDIIVITGDLVDGSVEYLAKDIEPLRDLQAPLGKYVITGNHEYYSGVFSWLSKFKELGLDPLLNEHRIINKDKAGLVIGGVTDYKAGEAVPQHKTDPIASVINAPEECAKILLAHQPVSIYEASKAGYDLQLSGHTHGGQYFPFSGLVKLAQPYIAGLYKHEKTWLYVNRGTGYWGPPIRLGAPAEITELTLTGKPENV